MTVIAYNKQLLLLLLYESCYLFCVFLKIRSNTKFLSSNLREVERDRDRQIEREREFSKEVNILDCVKEEESGKV